MLQAFVNFTTKKILKIKTLKISKKNPYICMFLSDLKLKRIYIKERFIEMKCL